MQEIDFKAHLRRQLGFLERSSQSYDSGNIDEAVRIATVIRVLVHSKALSGKGSSISLLERLNAVDIKVLSTASILPPNAIRGFTLGMIRMGGGRNEYISGLDLSPTKDYVPVSSWWNQIVFILKLDMRLSRKDIVLTAADKDGGAHVDKAVTKEYEALTKDGALGHFIYVSQGGKMTTNTTDAHFVAIRQMAYELLHSPELVNLAK